MCFTANTFCCCAIPMWVGALMIGLDELSTAYYFNEIGFAEQAAIFLGNSARFALLFVPSLFYNSNYRKTVAIIYSITTVLGLLGVLILTIIVLAVSKEEAADGLR